MDFKAGASRGQDLLRVALLDNAVGVVDGDWAALNGFHPASVEIFGPSTGAIVQLWASNSPKTPTHNGVQVRGDFSTDIIVRIDVPLVWMRAKVIQAGSFPVSVYFFGAR